MNFLKNLNTIYNSRNFIKHTKIYAKHDLNVSFLRNVTSTWNTFQTCNISF